MNNKVRFAVNAFNRQIDIFLRSKKEIIQLLREDRTIIKLKTSKDADYISIHFQPESERFSINFNCYISGQLKHIKLNNNFEYLSCDIKLNDNQIAYVEEKAQNALIELMLRWERYTLLFFEEEVRQYSTLISLAKK